MKRFTIEQVATMLDTPVRRVAACFDSGRLHGWQDPDTFVRYVTTQQLVEFVEEHGDQYQLIQEKKAVC